MTETTAPHPAPDSQPAQETTTAGSGSAETTAAGSQTLLMLRSAVHLLSALVITVWALFEWALPWPGVLIAAGFFVGIVLLWALFLSPKPVLRTDRFGQALIELLLIAGAVGALLGLGVNWIAATLFGVFGAVLGYFAGGKASQK